MLIFERSRSGRTGAVRSSTVLSNDDLPAGLRRTARPALPELSELQVVRHYTRLSQSNFSIDTQFYPLGSCTMKYNPRGAHAAASLPGFLARHPSGHESLGQGLMGCLYDLQQILKEVTGMREVSLTPMAGAQGEFAGVAMIRAYHQARGDSARTEILVPDAAHGTNPATAAMCGFSVREIATDKQGDVDLAMLEKAVSEKTAGIMLTNPSTLGVFERRIQDIARIVHQAGGLLFYDGANFNAILGKVKPGEMGFDVMHINVHKTFSTPHGGGGPGAGPVAAGERLAAFLPVPMVGYDGAQYRWLTEEDRTQTIGRLSAHAGNVGILLRAYAYIRMLGRVGMERVAEYASLNANYLLARLAAVGFEPAFPQRRASHELALTLRRPATEYHTTAMDFAKRLLDYGFHAPTTYFPMLVPECLLIEPTETEAKEDLDAFIAAMAAILDEARVHPEQLRSAPHHLPVQRLDDVKAARDLDLRWSPGKQP